MADYLKFAVQTAKGAAKILMKKKGHAKVVTKKKIGDFALDADYAAEKYIIGKIKKKYPTHSILSEEVGEEMKKSKYLWVIDPLDGTLNYSHDLPIFSIAIALLKNGEPISSVVYAPMLNELFTAEKGKGAYLNGKKLRVNKDNSIKKCNLTGSAIQFCVLKKKVSRHFFRALGCSSIELGYIAAGRFSARLKARGSDPYGYAAGSLLITEAGGKITDMKGKKWHIDSDGILASNKHIHKTILNLYKR